MNVVIYARFSSHSQTEQSIEGQLKVCYEYAESHNYTIVGEYIDRAQSGKFDNRADFQRMIADSDKHTFEGKSELYNITVENITATDAELPVIIAGYRQKGRTKRCRNITLRNFDITYRDALEILDRRLFIPEYAKEYPECWRFRNLPSYGLWTRHCENLKIENFNCKGVKGTHRKEKIFIDCTP